MTNKEILTTLCAVLSAICVTVLILQTTTKHDLQKENKALKEYYYSTETLLDSLHIDVEDSIFSTKTGFKYLKAHDNIIDIVK